MWCEAYSSLWEASQAVVLSGTLGEGLGEAARLDHSWDVVTPLASPCAISGCPLSTCTMQFKMLWCKDALGALWFQVNMKLLDTKILGSGSIPCPRPCSTLPGWALFQPCSCRDDAPAVEAWCPEHPASPCPGQDLLLPQKWGHSSWRAPAWVGWDCLRSWSWMRRDTNLSKKKNLPFFYPEIQVDPLAKSDGIQHQVVSWYFFVLLGSGRFK